MMLVYICNDGNFTYDLSINFTIFQFELPGLFIEYGAMAQNQDACVTWENVLKEVLHKWTTKNPDGRVIFIYSGKHTCEGTSSL